MKIIALVGCSRISDRQLKVIAALFKSAFTGREVHQPYVSEGVSLGRQRANPVWSQSCQ